MYIKLSTSYTMPAHRNDRIQNKQYVVPYVRELW